MERLSCSLTFRFSDLMTTLTYVLMENFFVVLSIYVQINRAFFQNIVSRNMKLLKLLMICCVMRRISFIETLKCSITKHLSLMIRAVSKKNLQFSQSRIQPGTGISCKESFQMCLSLSFHNYKVLVDGSIRKETQPPAITNQV